MPAPYHLTLGAHTNNWTTDNAAIGPLRSQRVFRSGLLPTTFAGSVADGYPNNVTVYLSYKTAGNTAAFVASIPPTKRIRLIYHHEPENEYGGNGAAFVAQYLAEYAIVKATNPAVTMGMAAMTYQYKAGRFGASGSFLPPATAVDFYGADNYETVPQRLAVSSEFLGWYNLVKNRGKELVMLEYGVGDVSVAPYSAQRVVTMQADSIWLTSTGLFSDWLYWYSSGANGSNWVFTDQPSKSTWSALCLTHNL
ncbi:MAG: hypothetical protein WCA46_30735 [Actinocatenispora sp.]